MNFVTGRATSMRRFTFVRPQRQRVQTLNSAVGPYVEWVDFERREIGTQGEGRLSNFYRNVGHGAGAASDPARMM